LPVGRSREQKLRQQKIATTKIARRRTQAGARAHGYRASRARYAMERFRRRIWNARSRSPLGSTTTSTLTVTHLVCRVQVARLELRASRYAAAPVVVGGDAEPNSSGDFSTRPAWCVSGKPSGTSSVVRGKSGREVPGRAQQPAESPADPLKSVPSLNPSQERQKDDDQQNQTQPTARVVAPAAAVGPGRECTQQQQNQNHNQDGCHEISIRAAGLAFA